MESIKLLKINELIYFPTLSTYFSSTFFIIYFSKCLRMLEINKKNKKGYIPGFFGRPGLLYEKTLRNRQVPE